MGGQLSCYSTSILSSPPFFFNQQKNLPLYPTTVDIMPSFSILIPYIMRSKSFSPRVSWYQKVSKSKTPSAAPLAQNPVSETLPSPPPKKPPAKTTLHHLPTELLLEIIAPLTTKELAALVLTCTNLCRRLDGTLWQRGLALSPALPTGTTILHRAAQCGWDQTLRVLFDNYSISPNLPRENLTALHWTCNHIHYRSTKFLLSRGADIEGSGSASTPLHCAAMAGNSAAGVMKLLLTHGADIHATDREGKTALHIASKGGYGGIVMTLLEHGAATEITDAAGYSPLYYAAQHGFVKIAQLLLQAGADPDAGGGMSTPLGVALLRHHSTVVEALIAGGADPDRCGHRVEYAQGPSRVLLAKYIAARKLMRKMQPLPRTPPLLHMAVETRNLARVQTLCKHKDVIDLEEKFEGRTALWLAASLGFGDVVDVLLDCGASWDARDAEGKMPCEVAYANGHKAVGYTLARWNEISWSALMAGAGRL
jgi:ankyrin